MDALLQKSCLLLQRFAWHFFFVEEGTLFITHREGEKKLLLHCMAKTTRGELLCVCVCASLHAAEKKGSHIAAVEVFVKAIKKFQGAATAAAA